MESRGKHTENRKYRKYGMRSKAGKYIVQCPFCDNSYSVSMEGRGSFVCINCGGGAGLQHVVREISIQEPQRELNDMFSDNYDDEREDLREAGNNSDEAEDIRGIMEAFVYAVAMNDKEYILSKLHCFGEKRIMNEEERFRKFEKSAFGKYLGNEEIRLKDATYLSGFPWPEGYSLLQEKMAGEVDYDGDGMPDTNTRGYQHFEVTLTDGEVFDVYFFEGEENNWTLRIL
ncbi:MAG: hypothetical protein IJ405_05005 [Lachnospiraceae bacterium]|nr:hypothetical protein [Lachnospiraceae bacterium]